MNPPVWRVEDEGEVLLPVSPTAGTDLVSLPFLVAAVRRRWRRVVATAGVCAFLALGLMQMGGAQHAATITLLVISDPSVDPNAAMTTNLSLLHTRALAEQVIQKDHLPLSPEALQGSVTAGALSDQLMTVTVTAPSDEEAITWATDVDNVYLDFRGQQFSSLADSTIKANQHNIDSYKSQIAAVTRQYDQAASTPGQGEAAQALLTQRAALETQLTNAEADNAQTKLQNQAIVGASHVVDAATVVHKSQKRHAALAIMSGLIGGTALGLVWVLAPAVLSTRLRRRDDVARALGLPVRFTAGPVSSRRWWIHGREARRNAKRLAHGLATAVPEDADTARLTLATIGDVRDGAYVVGALADELATESTAVAVVDLSASGVLAKPSRLPFRADPIRNRQLVKVHRHGLRVSELSGRTPDRVSSNKELGKAEVVLTLIELDLGSGVDVLGNLADASVVLVSTGRASAERLRSSATLLRQSDIHPAFAMLAGADDMDDSSGLLESAGQRDVSTRRSS
jgi:capsular polysaccharide biosynthesis protein